jgi:predicted RNase H-like nuclease (RuvC/YqgF family)
MNKIADKILSRIDIVTNINDKDLFIQAADEIKTLEEEIEDLRKEISYLDELKDEIASLEEQLCEADDMTRISDFDTDVIIEELQCRRGNWPHLSQEILNDIKTCIKNGDEQHLAVLFARLEKNLI